MKRLILLIFILFSASMAYSQVWDTVYIGSNQKEKISFINNNANLSGIFKASDENDHHSSYTYNYFKLLNGEKTGISFVQDDYEAWFLMYKNNKLVKGYQVSVFMNTPLVDYKENRLTLKRLKSILVNESTIPKEWIIKEISLKDGKLHGNFIDYYRDTRKIKSKATFNSGVINGKFQYFGFEGNSNLELNFENGVIQDEQWLNINEKDTLSFFKIDKNKTLEWDNFYFTFFNSYFEHNFSRTRDLYYLIRDLVKVSFYGKFKYTYYSESDNLKYIQTGNITDTITHDLGINYFANSLNVYYLKNNVLHYQSKMKNGNKIGVQNKYDTLGRLSEHFYNNDNGIKVDSSIIIEYKDISKNHSPVFQKFDFLKPQRLSLHSFNSQLTKIIYFYDKKGVDTMFIEDKSTTKKPFTVFLKKGNKDRFTFDSNDPFLDKIKRIKNPFTIINDTVFFENSKRIKSISEIRKKQGAVSLTDTVRHGLFREFNFDGTLKREGHYFNDVKTGKWIEYEFEQLHRVKYFNDLGILDSVSTKNRVSMVYHNISFGGGALYPNISSPDGRFVLYAYKENTDNTYLYDMELQKVIRSNINLTTTILDYLEKFWNTEFCFLSQDGKNIIVVDEKERYNRKAYHFLRFSLENETIMSSFGYNENSDQSTTMPFGWMSETMIYDNHKEEFLCLVGDGDKYGILKYSFLNDSIQFVPTEKEYRSLFQHKNEIICANKSSLDYFSKENFSKVREYVIKDSADYIYDSFHYSNEKIMVIGGNHKSKRALYIYDETGGLINRLKLPDDFMEISAMRYYKGNYFLLTRDLNGPSHVFKLTEKFKKLEWLTENFSENQEKIKNGTGCWIMTDYSPRLYNGTLLMTVFPAGNNGFPPSSFIYDLKDKKFQDLYPSNVDIDPLSGSVLIDGQVHYFTNISSVETNYNRKGFPKVSEENSMCRLDIDLSTGSANLHDYQVHPFKNEPEKQDVYDEIYKDEVRFPYAENELSSERSYKDTTENGKNCRFNYNDSDTNSFNYSNSYVYYANSKLIYRRNNEGKLIFYNYLKKKEREKTVNFTIDVNGNYLFYSPDKYYMGSKGIHENYYFTRHFKAYPLEQFDLKYNRPDIILDRLGYADSSLIAAYHSAYKKRLKKMGFTEDMLQDDFHLPEIKIENFEKMPTMLDQDNIDLNLHLEDSKYNLDRINVWVNDVAIYGTDGISLRDLETQVLDKTINVELAKGKNKVQVSVLNQAGAESYKETFEVECSVGKKKPNLYLITIGESEFQQDNFNLTYAAKDAKDVASLFPKSKVYDEVFTKTLTNDQVTRENVVGLQSFLEKADINDHVMVFLAGHGVLSADLDYYLATYDMDFTAPEKRGLMYEDLEGLLDGIKPLKKTLILDACHSGEIDKEEVELASAENTFKGDVQFRSVGKSVKSKLGAQNTLELTKSLFTDLRKGTGATVISSAGGMEFAMEGDDWNNGLFTYALLNGIESGEADLNGDKEIWLSELQKYVGQKVTELSNGKQQPTSRIENQTVDFRVW